MSSIQRVTVPNFPKVVEASPFMGDCLDDRAALHRALPGAVIQRLGQNRFNPGEISDLGSDFFQLLSCDPLGFSPITIGILENQQLADLVKRESPLLGMDDKLQPANRFPGVAAVIGRAWLATPLISESSPILSVFIHAPRTKK